MTVRVDFWVATAAVAPVIALSATVAIGDLTRENIRFRQSLIPETPSWRLANKHGALAYSLSYANIVWQSIVLLKALLSIANEGSSIWLSPTVIAFTEAISLIFIFVGVLEISLMRAAIFNAPEDQLKKLETSRAGNTPANDKPPQQGDAQQGDAQQGDDGDDEGTP